MEGEGEGLGHVGGLCLEFISWLMGLKKLMM